MEKLEIMIKLANERNIDQVSRIASVKCLVWTAISQAVQHLFISMSGVSLLFCPNHILLQCRVKLVQCTTQIYCVMNMQS